VIEPGVDLRSFVPGGQRSIHPSILIPGVGSGPLLEAFSDVRRARPEATLLIGRPEGPDAYRSAWLTVVPSAADVSGLVALESLACGTPVVARTPDLIDRPEIGATLGSEDAVELARAILDGLELAGDARTANACRRRAEDFSIERRVAAHTALYNELLEERGS
jgi:glycosyltransferase involved in cell wall biosynthesis